MEINPRDLAIYVGLATIAVTGWNLFFHSKLASLKAIWTWKDEFTETYNKDRLEIVEKFATKDEVARAVEKLDTHLSELRRSFDRLREHLENR